MIVVVYKWVRAIIATPLVKLLTALEAIEPIYPSS